MNDYICSFQRKNHLEGWFCGYASVFDVLDHQQERVARGAFAESLVQYRAQGVLPPMFYEHEPGRIVGQWCKMEEDEHGLWAEGEVELRLKGFSLETGGLSICFENVRSHIEGGIRVIDKLNIMEVSLVLTPANPLARILAA